MSCRLTRLISYMQVSSHNKGLSNNTWNLLNNPIWTSGNEENLCVITSKCCLARTIVGARTIACFPAETTQKIARSATSVLPKPTSPQINLSIGVSLSVKSLSTSLKACMNNKHHKTKRKECVYPPKL